MLKMFVRGWGGCVKRMGWFAFVCFCFRGFLLSVIRVCFEYGRWFEEIRFFY